MQVTRAFILSLFIMSSTVVAQAFTRAQFVGPYGIIRVLVKDFLGTVDTDGQVLFEAMDVPQQDSMLGPGKSIETDDRALQFICANRPQTGYECAIFIHNQAAGRVDTFRKMMSYKVHGEAAQRYAKLFKTDAQGQFKFVSVDGSLRVNISRESFEVLYNESSSGSPSLLASKAKIEPETDTLIITTVEDTLKISHIRNFWDSLNYTGSTRKGFLGMKEVFGIVENENRDFHFVYLTQSPELVSGKNEQEFLKKSSFPRGVNVVYSSNATVESRVRLIKQIFQNHRPKNVIFLSHNGSQDVVVFHELWREFPEINILTYIHFIYSPSSVSEVGSVLFPEQNSFVTPVELLLDLQLQGIASSSKAMATMKFLQERILTEDAKVIGGYEVAIPSFVNCEGFQWRWSLDEEYQFLTSLRDLLEKRCQPSDSSTSY